MPDANIFCHAGVDLWVWTIAVFPPKSYNKTLSLFTKTSGWRVPEQDWYYGERVIKPWSKTI